MQEDNPETTSGTIARMKKRIRESFMESLYDIGSSHDTKGLGEKNRESSRGGVHTKKSPL